jgi:glyoxylase-like metal-dependent hydrolase (beta-lactamase superfamily II)
MMRGRFQKKLTFGFAMLVGLMGFATLASAQQQPVPLKVIPLKGNLYWAQGGAGANTGIIVGSKGVIVVDTKMTVDSAKEFQAEIAKITPKPVATIILTHSDGDHVNGLAGFRAGLPIIAQENCKKEMVASAGSRNPAPQDRLPTKTIAKSENMTIDGVRLRLLYWGPAHTTGDIAVYLPDQKIVYAGDLIFNDRDQLIHAEKGGTVAGWFKNVKGLIALDADTYVVGHGDLMTKDDVKKKLVLIQGKWDKIKTLVAQGKSLNDVKTALGESTAAPAPGATSFASLTEVIYNEVSKKKS